MKHIYTFENFLNEGTIKPEIQDEDTKKALTENTDITNYYKDYSKEVKNAAKIVKDIISGMDMRVSRDTELYDAIIKLVNAVRAS